VSFAPRAKARRIALSGSAGTGKTTLGRRLASEMGVAYIDELMRRRLEAGLRLEGLSRDGWRALVRELWREQRALQEQAREGFVADRSSLDYAAFWLHYGLHEDEGETRAFFAEMAAASAELDAIVLFPWGVLPLVADGVRTPDPWTQLSFQGVLEGVLRRHARTSVVELLPTSDLEERLRWTLARLGVAR
jgi:nicotinamide riboside kinase